MNIVLCGFMGCGKTTLGRLTAKKLGYDFIDMDKYIEESRKMTVAEIFEKYGEGGFRDIEHSACREIAMMKNVVVGAGGGALTFERNIEVLKDKCKIVFLRVDEKILLSRIRGDRKRPLVVGKSDDEIIELYTKRLPFYEKAADIIFDGGDNAEKDAERLSAIFS